jgi:hypothetical protein
MAFSGLKTLLASAEAAVLAKDAKDNVDHNCLCQSILTKPSPSWG